MPKSSVNENAVASEVLTKALALLGPNGENWAQKYYAYRKDGQWTQPASSDAAKWCSIGAIRAIATDVFDSARRSAMFALQTAVGREIEIAPWNDSSTFPEVKSAFERAISLAKESEQANG